ncbi:ECH_0659 family protein [Wolbachia endosymbiont of Folsomia candida]|nr:hypothetical protein ASM33_08350 [Wolbachia endosymbiont of Folsomia candida]
MSFFPSYSFTTKFCSQSLEELSGEIEDIATATQDKFANELENIAYDSVQKFRDLLAKELNSIFNDIHSRNLSSLKSSLVDYAVDSNFINKKGEAALMRSLLNVLVHTTKNL